MKSKRKFLGYGVFFSSMWDKENWQFSELAGLHVTPTAAMETFNGRTTHCLNRETRKVFDTTRLNVRRFDNPHFVLAKEIKNLKLPS